MKLKIISGGQTGVDQAALRAAKALGVATGGTMPKGWETEAGPRPEFAELYGMTECEIAGYPVRTERNVINADMTIWCGQLGSHGFHATQRAARKHRKPFVTIPTLALGMVADMAVELLLIAPEVQALVINVAGSRESRRSKAAFGDEQDLSALFESLLNAIGKEGGKP